MVGEPLAEEDGLVGGELLGDVVGLTDFVGFGLPLGLGTVTEGFTTRLGDDVGLIGGGWLTRCVGVVAGELRCAVLSTFPLFREMCPVRYNPAAAAAAHRAAVEPATTSWRRRPGRRGTQPSPGPRDGPVPESAVPGSAPVAAVGRSARVAPGYPGSAAWPRVRS